MRFLFKLMVLGFLGLMALPSIYSDMPDADGLNARDSQVSAIQLALSAGTFAAGVAQDARGLCAREESVCAHGAVVAGLAMERARHGAHIAMQLIGSRDDVTIDDDVATGSISSD
ncbi:MAG: DUF5330 domain-containing protein [Pseudomonadota bacterium]